MIENNKFEFFRSPPLSILLVLVFQRQICASSMASTIRVCQRDVGHLTVNLFFSVLGKFIGSILMPWVWVMNNSNYWSCVWLPYFSDEKFIPFLDNKSLWHIGAEDDSESTIILDVTENDFAIGKITSFKQPPLLAGLDLKFLAGNLIDKEHFSWNILAASTDSKDTNVITPFTVYNDEFKSKPINSYQCQNSIIFISENSILL